MTGEGPDDAVAAIRAIWRQRRASVLARVGVIEQAISAVGEGQLTEDARSAAAREAHMLAGSAGTFGFSLASELARELELALEPAAPPDRTELPRLRETVRRLRHELSQDGAEPGEPETAPSRTVDLLVVGPDAARAARIAEAAAERGLEARSAAGVEEARRQVGETPPDLVLLALGGPDVLAEAMEFLAETVAERPVVVVTDPGDEVDRVEVALHGGRGFLPADLGVAEMVAAAVDLRADLRTPGRTVLACDDDPAVLDALASVLGRGGMQVITTPDSRELFAALERHHPDLVILDLEMPHLDGLELCRGMRDNARWEATPVLVLTARDDPETVQRVFEAGADDFVPKPFVGPELVARIASRLDRLRLYRALAETDHLTRLANRRRSQAILEALRDRARRMGQPLSLAVLDVDDFKSINDRLGHAAGDAALRGIGAALKRAFRADDVVARWGGDEFVVGMYGMTAADARERVARFLEELRRQELGPAGSGVRATMSGGVAETRSGEEDVDELYRAADAALYQAKAAGGDRVAAAGAATAGDLTERVDVVVVDDDENLVALLEEALRTRGWSMRAMGDGEVALRELAGASASVRAGAILLDWDLPGMDGLAVLRALADTGRLHDTRVIMLTARSDGREELSALEAGAVDFVAKPFSVPVLLARVRRALAR